MNAWVIEGRRVIPLLKRMTPKTGVSAVADKVAKYQLKQNAMANTDIPNNQIKNEQSFELEDLQRMSNNNQLTRKRVNSFESSSAKRKASQVSTKQLKQDELQNSLPASSVLSTITIPASSFYSASSSQIKSDNINTINKNDKSNQPKLLIMSTGSILSKPIVNTSTLSADQQLINADKIDLDETKIQPSLSSLKSTSLDSISQLITTSSSAKIYNPKVQSASSPKLMILPNSACQTKTLTIPISHNVKTLQLPAQSLQNSTILYSQQPIVSSTGLNCSSSTLKSMSGITIQAIKTNQGNKLNNNNNNNFIIMPNKANNGNQQPISQAQISGAKGLLRQMNAKEVKFISTAELKKEATDKVIDQNDVVNSDRIQQNQPTIILTNVSKEAGNNLASTSSPIRNLIKNHQNMGPNIIKVVPKCTNITSSANKGANKTSPNQKAAITIPVASNTNAAQFMEILKNIPISRISPQLPNSDGSKTTQISITQNPNSQAITKTIKIPMNATTESISKLIFNNMVTNCNSQILLNENIAKKVTTVPKSNLLDAQKSSTTEQTKKDQSKNKEIKLISDKKEEVKIDLIKDNSKSLKGGLQNAFEILCKDTLSDELKESDDKEIVKKKITSKDTKKDEVADSSN